MFRERPKFISVFIAIILLVALALLGIYKIVPALFPDFDFRDYVNNIFHCQDKEPDENEEDIEIIDNNDDNNEIIDNNDDNTDIIDNNDNNDDSTDIIDNNDNTDDNNNDDNNNDEVFAWNIDAETSTVRVGNYTFYVVDENGNKYSEDNKTGNFYAVSTEIISTQKYLTADKIVENGTSRYNTKNYDENDLDHSSYANDYFYSDIRAYITSADFIADLGLNADSPELENIIGVSIDDLYSSFRNNSDCSRHNYSCLSDEDKAVSDKFWLLSKSEIDMVNGKFRDLLNSSSENYISDGFWTLRNDMASRSTSDRIEIVSGSTLYGFGANATKVHEETDLGVRVAFKIYLAD